MQLGARLTHKGGNRSQAGQSKARQVGRGRLGNGAEEWEPIGSHFHLSKEQAMSTGSRIVWEEKLVPPTFKLRKASIMIMENILLARHDGARL